MVTFNRNMKRVRPTGGVQQDDEDELRRIAEQRVAPMPITGATSASLAAPKATEPEFVPQKPVEAAPKNRLTRRAPRNIIGAGEPTEEMGPGTVIPVPSGTSTVDAAAEQKENMGGLDLPGGQVEGLKNLEVDPELQRIASERKAMQDELASGKQKALMQANARSGLAGMGLAGGTSALNADISRTQDRSAALAMMDFDRGARDEGREDKRIENEAKRNKSDDEWRKIQQEVALNEIEDMEGRDVDGDGDIAGVDKKTVSADEREADSKKERTDIVAGIKDGSGTESDPYGGMLNHLDEGTLRDLAGAGTKFTNVEVVRTDTIKARDSDGNWYYFQIPPEHQGDNSTSAKWFSDTVRGG